MDKLFWKRLKDFVKEVQVNDPCSEDEQDMILSVCEDQLKSFDDDYFDDDFDIDDTDDFDDDWEERRENERLERASYCTCGAWKQLKNGEIAHVADCSCGAE